MTTEERGLANCGELLRFFGASLVAVVKRTTGTFEVAGQARKTNGVKGIRIPYLLNFE
jgi:hypothetical protein